MCEGSKERWLQAARVVLNMHGSIVRRHTGKALGHREILCNGGEFVIPHPCLRDSGPAGHRTTLHPTPIELYKKAFGATERSRMASPDGKIMHAEIQIGDSMIFLADEYPGMSAAPSEGAPPSHAIYLYVQDVDSVYKQAVAAGCKEAMPVADMFWGDRFGKVVDPFGHHWNLATHIEDVAPAEMERRSMEWMAAMASRAKSAGQS